jgi:hypothetical protein
MGDGDSVQGTGGDADHLVGKDALLEEDPEHAHLGRTAYRSAGKDEHRVGRRCSPAESPEETGKCHHLILPRSDAPPGPSSP